MNFLEAYNKLKSTDLKEVRNIDYSKILDIIKQSPVYIIVVALIGGTIFLMISMIGRVKINENKYSQLSQEYEKKLQAINEDNAAKKVYNEFVNNFPKPLMGNQLVDKVTELASNRGIQILSFTPGSQISNSYLSSTIFNITVVSPEYNNIILFIDDIEKSRFGIRIERLNAKLNENSVINQNQKDSSIVTDIQFNLFKLK